MFTAVEINDVMKRADAYASGVLSGKIPACAHIKAAVERDIADQANADKRGLVFDPRAATRAITFIESFCKHSKGKWAGAPLRLSPWQVWITTRIFGWLYLNGLRRFRTVYVEVPRKNGKSTWAAAIALYMLIGAGEKGAEVYSVATKRDQARIVFGEASRMVTQSSELSRVADTKLSKIEIAKTFSHMEALSADSKTLDGLNVFAAIVDEFHAHRDRMVYELTQTATGAREDPLIFNITTAGEDLESVCYEEREYGIAVNDGVYGDDETSDQYFAFIATIDEGDDWENDPRIWEKANPNWNVTIKPDAFEKELTKALRTPASKAGFARLRFNVWQQGGAKWLDMDLWNKCASSELDVSNATFSCLGLDLASTQDITAAVEVHLLPGDKVVLIPHFWVPMDKAKEREKVDRVPYLTWIQKGWMKATEGDSCDYDQVRKDILALHEKRNFQEVAYDPWNATQLITQLEAEYIETTKFSQGPASIGPASKFFETLILQRRLIHPGNHVLNWMARNTVGKELAQGAIRPDKKMSRQKIDGIVASVMGAGRAMLAIPGDSRYASDEAAIG